MKLTEKQIQQTIDAHNIISYIVQYIFDNEDAFKEDILGGKQAVGWESEDYEIERCHVAKRYRVTLKHNDGREKDIYVESNDVISWFCYE